MLDRQIRNRLENAAELAARAIDQQDDVIGRAKTEASGGVTLAKVRAIAETGVDYISAGALTHSAPALDLSLEVRP